LVIEPVTSSSPDWYFLGVSPKCGPTSRECLKRVGRGSIEYFGGLAEITSTGDSKWIAGSSDIPDARYSLIAVEVEPSSAAMLLAV
jgi:hypothetical protein